MSPQRLQHLPAAPHLEGLCHECAVWVGPVIRERLAVFEPEFLVQLPGRQEELIRAGLEAQPGEPHALGLSDDVRQEQGRDICGRISPGLPGRGFDQP
jgi:hypothetical protein